MNSAIASPFSAEANSFRLDSTCLLSAWLLSFLPSSCCRGSPYALLNHSPPPPSPLFLVLCHTDAFLCIWLACAIGWQRRRTILDRVASRRRRQTRHANAVCRCVAGAASVSIRCCGRCWHVRSRCAIGWTSGARLSQPASLIMTHHPPVREGAHHARLERLQQEGRQRLKQGRFRIETASH